jgi:hypothetical protein
MGMLKSFQASLLRHKTCQIFYTFVEFPNHILSSMFNWAQSSHVQMTAHTFPYGIKICEKTTKNIKLNWMSNFFSSFSSPLQSFINCMKQKAEFVYSQNSLFFMVCICNKSNKWVNKQIFLYILRVVINEKLLKL